MFGKKNIVQANNSSFSIGGKISVSSCEKGREGTLEGIKRRRERG